MDNLKPCPFCYSTDIRASEEKQTYDVQLTCHGCGIRTGFVCYHYSEWDEPECETKEEAIEILVKHWNTRAEERKE